jgi:hypothetical protein
MKKMILILSFISCCSCCRSFSQETPPAGEQQLESLTEVEDAEPEDDSYWQRLEDYRRHPVNLNSADENELKELGVLTALQVSHLISYRALLGNFIDIHELQSIPGWDVSLIRRLLPFITISLPFQLKEDLLARMRGGDHSLLLRISQVLEKAAGYRGPPAERTYTGSMQHIFFRYRYSYKNLLQFGLVGDKDAGEKFFRGAQPFGFDFYSIHFFARNLGMVRALALGDFTVNMGQGLIQWQSLAFRKGSETMSMERQSVVLRPYSAAGEYNFHRGIGISIQRGKMEFTSFLSLRKLSTSLSADSSNAYFSSFQLSGYHRSASEIEDRNNVQQVAAGGVARYSTPRWKIALNGIYYGFSAPLMKRDEPYNLFAINGNTWYNMSSDYSYTVRNIHFFGEIAVDKNLHHAIVNGILMSVDRNIDVSFLHRCIEPQYQAVNGNAFTENAFPSNENGLYTGISIHPASAWKINAYADVYRFPWLKFSVDAPSSGMDYLVQATYTPSKQAELYTRFRNEIKSINWPGNDGPLNQLIAVRRQSWRTQCNLNVTSSFTWRSRVEMSWYKLPGREPQSGFLGLSDLLFKPMMGALAGGVRFQYFETDGYDTRLYAYENDVLYGYSIPVFFDRGLRYYGNISYDVSSKTTCWLRIAQTLYPGKKSIGSGADAIEGHHKTELKFQVLHHF